MEDLPHQQNHNNTPEEQEWDDAFNAFYELGDKLRTPEVQEIIDQLIAVHDPDETQDPTQILLKYGKNLLPDEYYAFLAMYVKLQKEFSLQDGLNDEPAVEVPAANRELATYIAEEAKQLLYASHYSKLQRGGFTDEEKEIIGVARAMLLRLIDHGDMSDDDVQERYDQLEKCHTLLAGTHILEATSGYAGIDSEASSYDIDELNRAHELNERYRPRHSNMHPEVAEWKSLLPTHYWQVEMTDEMRARLERHLRMIDADTELARLDIDGLDLLPFSLDAGEVRDLLHGIPGLALEGVTGIYFKERSLQDPQTKTDDSNTPWVALAEHEYDFDSNDSGITLWVDAIAAHFERRRKEVSTDDVNVYDKARAQTIDYIKDTIVHEFGHAFHYKLPVALLNDWDIAVFESLTDQPVSRYVEVADVLTPGTYPMEDFAESFRLSLLHADQLSERAPDRAAAMRALINSCRSQ